MENLQNSDPLGYLKTLGLAWGDFKNKKVLEIGAGSGAFIKEAQKRGIDIVGLERSPETWEEEGHILPDRSIFIKGQAENLPFPDSSFDLVISRAGPPTTSRTKEIIKKVIDEAVRVLKRNGEFRFGPGVLMETLFLFENERGVPDSIMREKSEELLRSISPKIISKKIEKANDPHASNYYVLKKEE